MKSFEIDTMTMDIAIGFIGLLVAAATVLLQWRQFKKSNPPSSNAGGTRTPFGHPSPYARWRTLYWREVRATFGLAIISLVMVGVIAFLRGEVTMPRLASLFFWIGMFFYNIWVAQWYAWRIATKRRR